MSTWRPDSPIELDDGTLRCKQHHLEVCHKCSVDYTFMREEVLGMRDEEELDEEDEESDEIETGPPLAMFQNMLSLRATDNGGRNNSASSSAASTKSHVLWIHLGGMHGILKEIRDSFQAMIEDQVTVIQAYDEPTALHLLNVSQFSTVFVMETLPLQTYPTLVKALVSYATEQGGTVIFGFGYPCFTNMDEFKTLFAQFGKKWIGGSYTRETFARNDTPKKKFKGKNIPLLELRRRANNSLPTPYSMKALRAKGVTRKEAVYLYEDPQSPTRAGEELEAPIAFTNIGKGWLGYLGDVNVEESTKLVAKAMLGPRLVSLTTDIPHSAPGAKPNTLWILLGGLEEMMKEDRITLQSMIEGQRTVKYAYNEQSALQLLTATQMETVFIMGHLSPSKHPNLVKSLVSYNIDGGIVILGFLYPSFVNASEFEGLFAHFGKAWTRGDYHRETFVRNRPSSGNTSTNQMGTTLRHQLLSRSNNSLPDSYSMKAVQVNGITRDEAVYISQKTRSSTSTGGKIQAPVAFSSVGKGWLGYLGDVNAEESTLLVTKAMIELRNS